MINTKDILGIFEKLKSVVTVSGNERVKAKEIERISLDFLASDRIKSEVCGDGSVILRLDSEKSDAPTLLLDAHIDTIGLVVAEILEGGFLRFAPAGGIDRRILTGAMVEIHGKEKIKGIFSSVPPHLSKGADNKLPEFSEFLVDTGLEYSELCQKVQIGDFATFCGETIHLLNDRISTSHLDDKICCSTILCAVKEIIHKGIDTGCNVTVLLSAGEETNGKGAKGASFKVTADGAVALDVNFAKDAGVPAYSSSKIGDGAMISRSAVTDTRMTDILIDSANRAGAKFKIIAETEGTGTNADTIEVSNLGTPCAVLSVPISYMHTPCETCSLSDTLEVVKILVSTIENFEVYSKREETRLGVRVLK